MTTNDNKWYNKWKRIRASKREWFWFQNEAIYVMSNYNIFSNMDYIQIGKFPINLLTKETAWKQDDAMLRNSLGQFRKALIKIGKNESLMALSLAPK